LRAWGMFQGFGGKFIEKIHDTKPL